VLRGVGDDAAVVRARPLCVTSVDTMVEGVHFRLEEGWSTPAEVGWRALAAALSDLAAMGARPGEAYLALGLPAGLGEAAALALVDGALALAGESGVAIIGGDVVAAPALTVSVTAIGWSEDDERLVYREGAQPGDLLGVTGALGAAAAALAIMQGRAPRDTPHAAELLERARAPRPRLRAGRALAAAGVHAMIDVSDGIAADVAHLARASGAVMQVELAALPLAAGLPELAAAAGLDARRLAAGGGEDYELCFCAAESERADIERAAGVAISWIGRVGGTGEPRLVLSGERGEHVVVEGFEHTW
jgi:thiamine-monophosphate kinase